MTRILVVEDEPANLKLLKYILTLQGYETAGAKDGAEALELLAQSSFDLVLSDIKMPRLSGVALAQHLLSQIPITPIVLMTAYDFDIREDILALRVPCLSKPLSLELLLAQVQKVLAHSGKPASELVEH
jgi:CheY-like chemotaxis protein